MKRDNPRGRRSDPGRKLFLGVLVGLVLLGIFRLTGSVQLPHMNWRAGSWWCPGWVVSP